MIDRCPQYWLRHPKKAVDSRFKTRPRCLSLGLTISLEAGNIGRFPKAGNYASYCRCVKSEKISNEKKKGTGNRKNGNKYLSWAYVEAANFAIRYNPKAARFYDRKAARTNNTIARKALANKMARASYYIMRDQVAYDENKMFR